jgi:hypothetical protein
MSALIIGSNGRQAPLAGRIFRNREIGAFRFMKPAQMGLSSLTAEGSFPISTAQIVSQLCLLIWHALDIPGHLLDQMS